MDGCTLDGCFVMLVFYVGIGPRYPIIEGSVPFVYASMVRAEVILTSLPQSHLGRVHCYLSQQRIHSSTACASGAMSTADNCSYSVVGTLHPYYFSPLTHRSLTLTFTLTLTLLTIIIPLQPPASIVQA